MTEPEKSELESDALSQLFSPDAQLTGAQLCKINNSIIELNNSVKLLCATMQVNTVWKEKTGKISQ